MKRIASSGLGAVLLAWATIAIAQTSPVGLWKTIDEETGRAKSLVRIVPVGSVLEGRIEKLLDPDDPVGARCEACPDERRNRPILGLIILRNVRKAEGKDNQWEGGDILDPEEGKIYRVRVSTSPDGRRLEVRGYLGTPLFGRTQTWLRVE